jgi:diadenosine tetraphosphate (Ap4A) HIT family hydrolase
MVESAETIYQRALQAADADGRLPMPPVAEWDTFPFDGDLRVRPFAPPAETDRQRRGEDPAQCWRCQQGISDAIWSDEHWLLAPLAQPSGLPVVAILYPRAHHDLGDLPMDLLTEFGPLVQRIERAIVSLGEIGRVHVCRWGDGSAHFHVWFMARPARLPQTVGTFAAIWDDILPPVPAQIWQETLVELGGRLAASGGRTLTGGRRVDHEE